jgi:orotate phosphoribosyltransferase
MDDVMPIFKESGAILDGHFLLSSGLHSAQYLQCALVLQYPEKATFLGEQLARQFHLDRVDAVIAPALGGILVAHEVARALHCRAIFAERRQGPMSLRRGFQLSPGERVVAVEDVVTTGESLSEVIDLALAEGAVVVGVGSIVNRGRGAAFPLGVTLRSLLTLDIPTFEPAACPQCHNGVPLYTPGTRQSSSGQ